MEKTRIKTGLFGGTFNPIHIGHLALANYLCEYEDLDEVWFLVTPQNPFKKGDHLLDDYIRLEMVEAAIAGYPHFRASDFEFGLPRPSYTVEYATTTCQDLSRTGLYPHHRADNWAKFAQWHAPEEILRNHSIRVYPRRGYDLTIPASYTQVQCGRNAPTRNQLHLHPSSTCRRKGYPLFRTSGSIPHYSRETSVSIF